LSEYCGRESERKEPSEKNAMKIKPMKLKLMKLKSGVTKQFSLFACSATKSVMMSAMMVLFASGLARANDPDLSITPVMAHFPQVILGNLSPPMTFRIKNTHATNDLQLYTATITGPHSTQFSLGTDNCSSELLDPGLECTIEVSYLPTSFGSKMAMLQVPTDAPNSPGLVAFLSNDEDNAKQAERRLPPVLFSLNIPEVMDNGSYHPLSWSILGYHDSYKVIIAFFDCTGKAPGTCGANIGENFRSAIINATGTTPQPGWNFNGEAAVQHHYNYSFDASTFPQVTPPGNHQIVVRFYAINNMDSMSQESSLSLLIPGDLTSEYYDSEGRRITKYISVP